jgi:hypothetical protein
MHSMSQRPVVENGGHHVVDLEGGPADPGHVKDGAGAEDRRRIDRAVDGDVGARTGQGMPERQFLSGPNRDGAPGRDGSSVEPGRHVRAGDGHGGVAIEAERAADELAFERGGIAGVADEKVRQAEGPGVDRPGRRESLLPMADATGQFLDGRFQTGLHHREPSPAHDRHPPVREAPTVAVSHAS